MLRLAAIVAGAVLINGCSGSTATPTARSSPTPVEDCRGSTETAPGGPSPLPAVSYVSLTVDGKLRDYRLFQPPALDVTKPVPLVVVLHGSPADAALTADINHFDGQATRGGFLAASPNGCGGYWAYTRGGSKLADEDFIGQVVHRLEAEFQIDKARVFVVAISAGSPVAYRLACDLSNEIAAMASLAGRMRLEDDCQPARPVSILEMHGTEDDRVPFASGEASIQRWKTLNGCVGDPTVTQSGITTTSVWNRCNGGAVVRFDKVVGGHHTWFGSDFAPVPGEPNANAVIWDFFSSLPPRA